MMPDWNGTCQPVIEDFDIFDEFLEVLNSSEFNPGNFKYPLKSAVNLTNRRNIKANQPDW